jgi:hypothetical protein
MAVQTKTKRLAAQASSGVIGTADVLVDNGTTAGDEIVTSTIIVVNTTSSAQTFKMGTSTATSFQTAGLIAPLNDLGPYEFWTFTLGLCLDVSARYLLFSGSDAGVVAQVHGARTTGNV